MGDKTGAVAAAKSYVQELLDAYYNYEDALNRADLGKTQKAGANAKLDSMWKAYLEAERAYKALAKKSRATDLEPIPVEDASSECARCNGSGRNGANPCEKCNGSGWADPKKQGKPFTDAKDSSRSVRLHRALDSVMDSRGVARDFDPEMAIRIAADNVAKLRKQDVFRVLEQVPHAQLAKVAAYIKTKRDDLAQEVTECVAEIKADQ